MSPKIATLLPAPSFSTSSDAFMDIGRPEFVAVDDAFQPFRLLPADNESTSISPTQLENVPIRQCTAPARNIFAKQPLENAGTWQGERKQSRA